jgi:RNA polymerase sigma-70 factor (ECF subfamily)
VETERREECQFKRYVVPELDGLLRLAMSLTDQPADAEDLVQETLLRAYRSISRLDGAHRRAWLYTIMGRSQANSFRRRRPVLLAEYTAVDAQTRHGTVDTVGEKLVDSTFDAVVEEAFKNLSVNDQDVLRLIDVSGLSYADAALVLGVTVDAVASRLHRARAKLREDLASSGLAPKPRFRWQGAPQ